MGKVERSFEGHTSACVPFLGVQVGRVEGSREGNSYTRTGRVEESFEGHALVCVPFIMSLGRVEWSREGHAPTFYFGAYTAFCGPFLGFGPRFKGLGHFLPLWGHKHTHFLFVVSRFDVVSLF